MQWFWIPLCAALACSVSAQAAEALAAPVAAAKKVKKVRTKTPEAPSVQAVAATDEVALNPDQLALAERVEVGRMPCEQSAAVQVSTDNRLPGHFWVALGHQRFAMVPTSTTSGAIRLEDMRSGVVWLQLANKSMLMDQRAGKRLADACMSASQTAMALAMEQGQVPGLLDGVKTEMAVAHKASNAKTKFAIK